MIFKKYNSRVYGVEMNAAEKKALEAEIKRQEAEYERTHEIDLANLILYLAHTHLGFGRKRLRRLYDAFTVEHNKLIAHYELPENENSWIAGEKLKEIGVDVTEWDAEKRGRQT